MLQYCFVQLSIFAFAVCYARSFIFILFGSLFLTFALGVPSRIHTQKVSLPRNSSHRSAEVLLSSRVMDFIMVMSMFCGHLHRSQNIFFPFLRFSVRLILIIDSAVMHTVMAVCFSAGTINVLIA